MTPLVSIIIPAYNAEKWLDSTIESAISQTWKNKEIIVIDDGSTDQTYSIAKKSESPLLNVVRQNNAGASAARNKGLELAQGDFIQWLDADDILAPDKIKIQLENSDQDPGSTILYSSAWGQFYHRLKSVKINRTPMWYDLSPVQWLKLHLEFQYFMANCSWLVSRQLTSLTGRWNEKLTFNDDGEYFCRVVSNSKFVKFIPDAFSYYRKGHLSSLSRSISVSPDSFKSLSLSLNISIDRLLQLEESEETRRVSIAALNRLNYNNDESVADILELNRRKIKSLGGIFSSPKQSKKFTIAEKIIGNRSANYLKVRLWYFQILLEKFYERLLSIINNDGI